MPASPPVAVKKNWRATTPAATRPNACEASVATRPSGSSEVVAIDCGRQVAPPSVVRSTELGPEAKSETLR